jgi:hypothetical protein
MLAGPATLATTTMADHSLLQHVKHSVVVTEKRAGCHVWSASGKYLGA